MDSVHSRKRLAPCDSNPDIISNLPTNIQDNILICLPIQDAARTCILSKNWRFRWHYIPELVFDDEHFFKSRSSKSPREISEQIYQILLLHCGNLQKFVLSFDHVIVETRFMDQLILFLSRKDVKEFTLSLPYESHYRLPSTLFEFSQCTHLNLSAYVFGCPPEYTGFCRLTDVDLTLQNLKSNEFKNFVSKCHLLQRLVLYIRRMDDTLEIDVPSLKFLRISWIDKSISFKNVPVLSSVIIESYKTLIFPSRSVNFLWFFPAVEYLCACRQFLKYMCVGASPKRMPVSKLEHLRYVELSELCFSSSEDVYDALLLIRFSPNLQKLKIKAYANHYDEAHISNLHQVLSKVEDNFNQLQEITLEEFNGTVAELEFLEFVLVKSVVLKKIIICPPKGTSAEKRLEIVTAAARFKRASTYAELIFSVGY